MRVENSQSKVAFLARKFYGDIDETTCTSSITSTAVDKQYNQEN